MLYKHLYLQVDTAYKRLQAEFKKYGSVVVAVDFDNTLYDFHGVGLETSEIIVLLRDLKSIGCFIVVWTASEELDFVRQFCLEQAIPFDAVNENPPFFKGSSRKIYYNELLDDRAGLLEVYVRLRRLADDFLYA